MSKNSKDFGWHAIAPEYVPKLLPERLLSFGFKQDGYMMEYVEAICGGGMKLEVRADVSAEPVSLATRITDVETGEPYTLHIARAQGAFVGQVREVHRNLLGKIFDRCGERNIDPEYEISVLGHIANTYRDFLEHPFTKSDASVIRNHNTGKWYAVFQAVEARKIGLKGFDGIREDSRIHIINLHATVERVAALVDGEQIFPGFHMNKKYWYTIPLNGVLSLEELFPLIRESWEMSKRTANKVHRTKGKGRSK